MSSGFRSLSIAIVALAFALRIVWLDVKPAHFDEGVNGWFVDAMTRQGYYAYDPTNFHGPLHYYVLFVSQTLFGRNLWALRLPLVLFSTASVALVFAFRRQLGAGACLLAALAMAVSPAGVFYGRYAIHEAELVFFLMLATWGLAGLGSENSRRHLWAAGLGLTGAVLTKETYVLHFAALAAGAAWWWWRGAARVVPQWKARDLAAVAVVCAGLIVFFYSGGFLHWSSLPGLWQTFAPWLATGLRGETGHEKEWWYWLQLLGRYEWPALLGLLAAPWLLWSSAGFQPVAVAQASLPARRLPATLAAMSLAALAAYSAIAYKTPWCLLALLWPLHLLFGVAIVRIHRALDPWLAPPLAALTLAVSLALTLELNFRKFTDETEPYVYVQTRPDLDRVLGPLRALVARDPLQRHLIGHVVMADIHPLPWLLGDFTRVDFPMFDELPESLDAAFLLIDEELADQVEPRLRHAYFREPLQIRGQAEGTALLYLRVQEFRDFFPERVPEFVAVEYRAMIFAASMLYAVAAAVLVAIGLAFAGGGLRTGSALLAYFLGAAVAVVALWPRRGDLKTQRRRDAEDAEAEKLNATSSATSASLRLCVFQTPLPTTEGSHHPGPWEWTAIVLFALFALRAFLWLVFTDGDSIAVLSPNNLGDLSLHLTYIRHLASGVPFWPDNPIFTGGPLVYPIGVDLFNALLALAGVDVLRGLVWVGLGGAALTGAALWRWGRGFALLGFLANGGLMGFAFFATGVLDDFQAELAWKSLPLALFVTQRGLLFALPAGLLLLASWRSRFFEGDPRDRLPWPGELLLYAALPVFHLHTFLFLSLLLATWFVTQARLRRTLAAFVGAAFLPATVLTLLVTGGLRGASMLGWKPGWMWDDEPWVQWCAAHLPGPPELNAAVLFWPMNFGVLPLLLALLCWRIRRTDAAARAFVFPALGIFLLCCFVKFAPWEWDNTKLMLWSYLAVLPYLWSEVLAPWPRWARVAALFALCWSGLASLFGGLDATHTGYKIARRSELDAVMHAVRAIPVQERFAGHPTYNHPLLLAGRKMALGYPGHLWSHGLPYQDAEPRLEALLNGEADWRAHAAALDVRYVFFGSREEEHYPESAQPWRAGAALVAAGEWGALYDLKTTPAPAPSDAPAPR